MGTIVSINCVALAHIVIAISIMSLVLVSAFFQWYTNIDTFPRLHYGLLYKRDIFFQFVVSRVENNPLWDKDDCWFLLKVFFWIRFGEIPIKQTIPVAKQDLRTSRVSEFKQQKMIKLPQYSYNHSYMITFIGNLRQFSLIKAIEFRRHKFFGAIGHYFQCPQAYLKSLEHRLTRPYLCW